MSTMFGLRRYRLFLLVAALAATTIYYLSSRSPRNMQDERLDQRSSQYGLFQPRPKSPAAKEPAPQHRPEDVLMPAEVPPARASSRIVSLTSSMSRSTTTASSKAAVPTFTGEELLKHKAVAEEELVEEGSGRWEADTVPTDGRKARWQKPKVHFPLAKEDTISLPSGPPKKLAKIQATFAKESPAGKKDRISKLMAVKESFKHAWNGYKQHGLPHDEVQPISKDFKDPFMGWGATLVDTLDTLWIMGMKEEFENALVEVEKIDFGTSMRKDIPLFETVIRYLGGLIAAYDVSNAKYSILLTKAEELAEILMGAFDTPNRMPLTFYNWAPSYTSQPHRASTHVVMAELGSLSVEMTRLALITGKHEYYDAIARITDELEKWQPHTLMPGLWPLKVDASGCKKTERNTPDGDELAAKPVPVDADDEDFDVDGVEPAVFPDDSVRKDASGSRKKIVERDVPSSPQPPAEGTKKSPTRMVDQEILGADCNPQGLAAPPNAKSQTYGIGGQADSTYEYFPKMYALLGGRSPQYKNMYLESATAIREQLLFRPMIKEKNRKILFASKHDLNPKATPATKKKDVITYEVTHLSCFVGGMFGLGAKLFGLDSDLELAKQLTDGCVWAYESMPAGVMAESAAVVPCPNLEVCAWSEVAWHEALDPQLEERFAAVQSWNKNQQRIYEQSRREAMKEQAASDPGEASGPEPTLETVQTEANREKRQILDGEPARTAPKLEVEADDTISRSRKGSSPLQFVPKVALSHERYVQARVLEERLPPSYTKIFDRHYGLRPEAIESVFYMYRITGDEIWRQKGWKMFEAIQSATQTDIAHAAVKDVTSSLGELDDVMESFWLAETLKYFYLLFDDPSHMSLDEWVLNTEAHPFSIKTVE